MTRERVLELVHRHGWNATAFQTLETGYQYFFHGDDACVAYVDTGRAWVAAGAPIAAAEALGAVAAAFVAAARAAGRRCCFFATEDRLLGAAGEALRSLPIGEQPVWDPTGWPEVVARHASLREQLRRARAKRVVVREADAAELDGGPVRAAMARLAESWLATRAMAPMDFVVRLEPFTFPAHRRCFLAEIDGELVAFAGVVPVPARGGWFIEDLVRAPEAPNGTGELLVDAVMRWAGAAGSRYVTLGLAPLAGELPRALRLARRGGRFLYDFEGIRAYKAKLRPNAWTPIALAYPAAQSVVWSVIDALAAFARGGLLGFALRTVLRGPTVALLLLAALLVPWTGLLAVAPVWPWFGAAWIKWGWVGFDVAVCATLFHLARRPSHRLATLLSAAVTGDAVLTAVQALVWNLPRARGALDVAIIAVACAAPTFAALVLFGARRRLRLSSPPWR